MNFRYALAGLVAAGAVMIPAAAAHADTPSCQAPGDSCGSAVIPEVPINSGFVVAPAVLGETAVQVAPSTAVPQQTSPATGTQLPFTGGDVAGLTAAGSRRQRR